MTATATTWQDLTRAVRGTLRTIGFNLRSNGLLLIGLFYLPGFTNAFTTKIEFTFVLLVLALPLFESSSGQSLKVVYATGVTHQILARTFMALSVVQWAAVTALFAALTPSAMTLRETLFGGQEAQPIGGWAPIVLVVTFALLTGALQICLAPSTDQQVTDRLSPWYPLVGALLAFSAYLVVSLAGHDLYGALAAVVVAFGYRASTWSALAPSIRSSGTTDQRRVQHRRGEYHAALPSVVFSANIVVGLTIAAPTWLHFGSRHSGNPDAMWVAAYAASAIGCAIAGFIGPANHVVTHIAAGYNRRHLTKWVTRNTLAFASVGTALTAGLGLVGFSPNVFQILTTSTTCLCAGFATALLAVCAQGRSQFWHVIAWLFALGQLPYYAVIPFGLVTYPEEALALVLPAIIWPIALAALWCWAGIKLPLDAKPEVGDHV